jgi:hypothetical protein
MRRMILRMIATGSLSAFSASVLQGTGALSPGGAANSAQAARPSSGIERVRATQTLPASQQPSQPLELGKASSAPAGRVPPRGSLLDLSV